MTKSSSHTARSLPTKLFYFFALVCAFAIQSTAQEARKDNFCNPENYNHSRNGKQFKIVTDLREKTLPASGGTIFVDGGQNGGVRVEGWDRNEVLVRACVQTAAETEAAARELAARLSINTNDNRIVAKVSGDDENRGWSVSYQIFVPRASALDLKAHNGGIGISDVNGQIRLAGVNGGVSLKRVGGSVRGNTVNGGLSIELAGDSWQGEGLDVSTQNGGVRMSIPENYSARLETGTVNGGVKVDYPVTVQGRVDKQLAVTLGSGGATLRAMTTNGGVSIKRQGTE